MQAKSISKLSQLMPFFPFSRNVWLNFVYKLSNGIARGVWSHASMVSYIYLLEHNSAKVDALA